MFVPGRTSCPTRKGCKSGYLDFERKRLEPRELPWQGHHWFQFVSFVMCISGAKFEDYCSNTLRDILDNFRILPFQLHSLLSHHSPNLHNTKTLISLERKQICLKGKRHSAALFKSLQLSSNYFSFHRHFNKYPVLIQFCSAPLFLCAASISDINITDFCFHSFCR